MIRSQHPIARVVTTVLLACLACVACGGAGDAPPRSPDDVKGGAPSAQTATAQPCGDPAKVHRHELSDGAATEALVPCARDGRSDYSGLVRIETIPEGVHVTVRATDDQVNMGMLGDDVKTRDAVIVYPRGRGSKAVEVPLVKTEQGYTGDRIVLWEELDAITDEGTKMDIAIYDHDGKTGETAEEMHVQVAVSTGKSCERAIDENPQTIEIGKRAGKDLTADQLGAPMRTSAFFAGCRLGDAAKADICVAVKNGRPLGVSVKLDPRDNRAAACIDRATRKLRFPASERLDVVHQTF